MIRISIIIPLYNKEPYIKRCIQSILDQTYQSFEIIIINDGSTDRSIEIAKEFNDKRIRIFNQNNAGVSAARNRGIREAQYPYIAFLDADDEWAPPHLEQIHTLMLKYPAYNVYGTFYKNIEKGTASSPILKGIRLQKNEGIITNYFRICALGESPIHIGSIVAKKDIFNDFVSFPTGITSGEDIYTLACMMLDNDLVYSKSPSYIRHMTPNDRIAPRNNPIDRKFDLLIKIAPHKKYIRQFVASWHRRRMVAGIEKKDMRLFLKHLIKSLTIYPFQRKVYTTSLIMFYRSISRSVTNKQK